MGSSKGLSTQVNHTSLSTSSGAREEFVLNKQTE